MSLKARLILALTFSWTVGAMSLESTRRSVEGNPYLSQGHRWTTQRDMKEDVKLVDNYRARHRRLPNTFDEVQADLPQGQVVSFRDGWDRPLRYVVQGNTFYLESYGADGRPGGRFMNADLRSDQRPGRQRISYAYLASLPEFSEIVGWTVVTMAMCFYIAFAGTKTSERITVSMIVTFVIVGLVTAIVSGVMTMIHVYPNH